MLFETVWKLSHQVVLPLSPLHVVHEMKFKKVELAGIDRSSKSRLLDHMQNERTTRPTSTNTYAMQLPQQVKSN